MKYLVAGFCLLLVACSPAKKPPNSGADNQLKVMSINACADQLLLTLANKDQIASLSYYSKDAASSPFAHIAKDFPTNHMSAEEIVKIRPDILFAGTFEADAIRRAAKALDLEIINFGVPADIKGAQDLITKAGAALKQPARAQALNNEISVATAQSKMAPIKTLIYYQGGFSAGPNTLVDELMTRAGLYNMARDYGVGNWGHVDIERIIANPPQIIIISDALMNGIFPSTLSRNNALKGAKLKIKFAHIPNKYSYCGGAVIPKLSNELSRIRREYD